MKLLLFFLNTVIAFEGIAISRRNFLGMSPALMSTRGYIAEEDNPSSGTYITASNNNISLYGSITEDSCFQLQLNLVALDDKLQSEATSEFPALPIINLHLQSLGGSLMPAFYICDLIRNLNTPVNTYIDGYAASAASLIAVCGAKRYMTKNSVILIHQLSGGLTGKYSQMEDDLENSRTLMNLLENIYISNTRLTKDDLDVYLQQDIWWNSTSCVKFGLVDQIV